MEAFEDWTREFGRQVAVVVCGAIAVVVDDGGGVGGGGGGRGGEIGSGRRRGLDRLFSDVDRQRRRWRRISGEFQVERSGRQGCERSKRDKLGPNRPINQPNQPANKPNLQPVKNPFKQAAKLLINQPNHQSRSQIVNRSLNPIPPPNSHHLIQPLNSSTELESCALTLTQGWTN